MTGAGYALAAHIGVDPMEIGRDKPHRIGVDEITGPVMRIRFASSDCQVVDMLVVNCFNEAKRGTCYY